MIPDSPIWLRQQEQQHQEQLQNQQISRSNSPEINNVHQAVANAVANIANDHDMWQIIELPSNGSVDITKNNLFVDKYCNETTKSISSVEIVEPNRSHPALLAPISNFTVTEKVFDPNLTDQKSSIEIDKPEVINNLEDQKSTAEKAKHLKRLRERFKEGKQFSFSDTNLTRLKYYDVVVNANETSETYSVIRSKNIPIFSIENLVIPLASTRNQLYHSNLNSSWNDLIKQQLMRRGKPEHTKSDTISSDDSGDRRYLDHRHPDWHANKLASPLKLVRKLFLNDCKENLKVDERRNMVEKGVPVIQPVVLIKQTYGCVENS